MAVKNMMEIGLMIKNTEKVYYIMNKDLAYMIIQKKMDIRNMTVNGLWINITEKVYYIMNQVI